MPYIDNCEVIDRNNGKVEIRGLCRVCRQPQTMMVNKLGLRMWCDGEYIQTALPNLSAGEREFLMSGTCDPCFDKLFKEEDSE
jgi:hypothetical protein